MAAAWLAVLIPPMLRSRVENRPNSSVTDFRDQLNKLQNTATPPRGAVRAMGRPLAQSPLTRPVAAGRPNQPVLRSGVTRHPTESERANLRAGTTTMPSPQRSYDGSGETPRYRSHGDPTGGQHRASQSQRTTEGRAARGDGAPRREVAPRVEGQRRSHGDPTGGQRRPGDVTGEIKRRRSNILFMLVTSTACTLFLAATTSSDVMLYLFAIAFLSLFGYLYLLAQQNGPNARRAEASLRDGWADSY